ncbi:hypothetical protein FJQ98_16335 [Lysinibacillus agricola]|uniref:Uncharacterized protein n=1 Tax=Lysinibacillus agricola TaxID=2590012 RepID=A0ABX7ALN7_9BACI|nr:MULTISPECIES: hypothetical protein [Lysinibacillus]QQP10813.1 hypothetical protein FJQ98_16335 [Lysinibacillus agricola]
MKIRLSLEKIKRIILIISTLIIGYSIGATCENIKFQNKLKDLEEQFDKLIEMYENN